jgi:tripartite ATP-independent transporter DctP family solute receptor
MTTLGKAPRIRKRYGAILMAAAAVCLVLACGRKSGGFRPEYRMQVTVGPANHWGRGAAKFAELVAEKTGGRVNVKPYYGGQLLKGAQLNSSQMVAGGAIDCALESTINTAPVIPAMNIFSIPFFVQTYENLDRLESGKTGDLLFEQMRAKGLTPLAWGENGFRQLTNSKHAVDSPDDLNGLKVRVVGSPIFIDIFRVLGADPVNMNWGDAVTAFQQRVVDGQENPAGILLAVQIYQYHKHITYWNYVIDPLMFYWNEKQFDAFPQEVQTAIREAAEEAARYQKALARAGLDDGTALRILQDEFGTEPDIPNPTAYLQEKGAEITVLTPEQTAAFKQAVQPVADKWLDVVGADVVQAANDDLETTP